MALNNIKAGLSKADDLVEVIAQRARRSGNAKFNKYTTSIIDVNTQKGRAWATGKAGGVQTSKLEVPSGDCFIRTTGAGETVDYVKLGDIELRSTDAKLMGAVTDGYWKQFLDIIFG